MMNMPTAEQIAFHEELKPLLDKHQRVIGELAMVAILAQVAGSLAAIAMRYHDITAKDAGETIRQNGCIGMQSGLEMIDALNRGDN